MNAEIAGKPVWPVNDTKSSETGATQALKGGAADRDTKGRFVTGNSGGGRKKGSRNRLTETVLSALESDFAEYGQSALEKLREDDPAAYLRLVASLVPRDLILKREQEPDYSDLSDGELAEIMWRAWKSGQIRRQLDGIKG